MPNARTEQDAAEGRIEAARYRREPQSDGNDERARDEQGAWSNRRDPRSQHEGEGGGEHPEGDQGHAGGECRGDPAKSSGLRPPAEGGCQAVGRADGDQAGDAGTHDEPYGREPGRNEGGREAGTDAPGAVPHAAGGSQGGQAGGSPTRSSRRFTGLALRPGVNGPTRSGAGAPARDPLPTGLGAGALVFLGRGHPAPFRRASSLATLAESSA